MSFKKKIFSTFTHTLKSMKNGIFLCHAVVTCRSIIKNPTYKGNFPQIHF